MAERGARGGRVAVFGGVYSNYLALEATLADARRRGAESFYCLGDLGGFGPFPDRVFPLLDAWGVEIVQGNYDQAVGHGLEDCGCGYTDPRDNRFAAISYDYTLAHTAPANRRRMRVLSPLRRVRLGRHRLLLCHGSPRRVNEFLWESTTPDGLIRRLLDEQACDAVLCTHTGIKWSRRLPGAGWLINVGAIGRPENDGTARVWYCMLELGAGGELLPTFHPVRYDHRRLAREMNDEGLPAEFIETILNGWWTTCLEILPAKERARGRH